MPRRVPRQIESLFSQGDVGGTGSSSALLYGTQGGGRLGSYTEFNAALEEAIRLRAADAEIERDRESHKERERGMSPDGVAANSPNWVKPQPPERPQAPAAPPLISAAKQQQHRQLKPAVG